jgi:hypothetical protein
MASSMVGSRYIYGVIVRLYSVIFVPAKLIGTVFAAYCERVNVAPWLFCKKQFHVHVSAYLELFVCAQT